MTEVTLESLAARVAELERKSSAEPHGDWRELVGMFDDNEFTRSWMAETAAIRLADRAASAANPEDGE